MKKSNGNVFSEHRLVDHAAAATEQMNLYCAAHPGSPSDVRHPRLFIRGELWIALLGPSVEEGIVGIGPTVTAALRAFDSQYLAGVRPSLGTRATADESGRSDSAARGAYRGSKPQLSSCEGPSDRRSAAPGLLHRLSNSRV